MKIDRNKFEDAIALRIQEAAQNLIECKCADCGARHRLAGRIAGLADILDDLYRNWRSDDESLMFIVSGEATYRQSEADDSADIRVVRYDTEAARAITEVSEEAANGMWSADYEKAKEDLAKEPKAGDSGEDVPDGSAVEDPAGEVGAGIVRIQQPRRKHQRFAPQVKADDVLVWLLSRGGDSGVEIPIDDIAIQFYLKGGRDDTSAHKAALNLAYILEKRGLTELHSGHGERNHVVVRSVSLTTHGVFEAQRIRGPLVSDETKSDEELQAEYAHLAEEVRDA